MAQILNKPALAAVATSGSYNDLSNKPIIPAQGAHLVERHHAGQHGDAHRQQRRSDHLYGDACLQGRSPWARARIAGRKWQHTTNGSTAITYKWTLGSSASEAYAGVHQRQRQASVSDVEVLTPASLTSQIINPSAVIAGTRISGRARVSATPAARTWPTPTPSSSPLMPAAASR